MGAWLAAAVMTLSTASPTYESSIAKAVTLYNEAEWDAALRELGVAEPLAKTDAQRISVWMHQGIMLANVPDPEAARAAWKKGLTADPKAELPLAVSPRVRSLFQELQRELKPKPPPTVAAKPGNKDAPKQATLDPQPKADDPPPFMPRPQVEELRFPVVPIVALGTGVVAGGVGLGFALGANSHLESARHAGTTEEKDALRGRAGTESTVANVSFAIAGAAALTALITFIVLE